MYATPLKVADTSLVFQTFLISLTSHQLDVSKTYRGHGRSFSLKRQDPRLDRTHYKRRTGAIEKFAFVARQRGNKVFALQDGGMCLRWLHIVFFFSTRAASANLSESARAS